MNHINRFENVYGLKEKLVFCINSISDNQLPINLDNPNLNIVNLPYLDNRNAGLFPLSNEYLTTLEAAVNNPEV